MASNSGVFQQLNTSPHHCKECGIYLNSAESLEVHLQYHKENLLNKWATQAATSHAEETNNNNNNNNNHHPKTIKREFMNSGAVAAAADSSDSMTRKSPEYSRTTPETIFGHPPTPQSYQSASSPYQNHHDTSFSPNFQNFQMKQERTNSPNSHYPQQYQTFPENQFFGMEQQQQQQQQNQNYPQDFQMHKYRYHPYQQYERPQSNSAVSSSSPAYPPQPTPSPSPKQCDKCGFVCDSAAQLLEHQNMAHPSYHHNHMFFNNEPSAQIKSEDDAQSEILDLDSHKVHQVYPPDEEKRPNNDHSVSALLNSWSPPQKMYQQQQYMNGPPTVQEKLFMHGQEFVSTTSQDSYRFEHHPSSQVTSVAVASATASASGPPPTTKSANWKSNEARRPKTYNCTACNKWFTSSGHLKRHYNTTLHKNAVKSSGQPDPASMPISAHHHPARDPVTVKDDGSGTNGSSPGEEDMPPPPQQQEAPPPPTHHAAFGMMAPPPPTTPVEGPHFQMYPNGSAPHVTQATDTTTSSLNITGEFVAANAAANNGQQQDSQDAVVQQETQPLPSFAQFHRYGLLSGYGTANVGGGGPATAPYCYYPDPFENAEPRTLMYKTDDEEYRITVLTVADPAPPLDHHPQHHHHHHHPNQMAVGEESTMAHHVGVPMEPLLLPAPPPSPEKAHTKRDYEEGAGSPRITSTVMVRSGLYKCIDCDKTFNKACYLTQHNKTFHCGDKPFKCSRCGKRFSNEETHEEHASKHAGDKPHKCDRCPKQFNHKTDLRRHMCLHTGQKPFVCDTCGKGFIRKDHMLKHCETHFRKNQGKLILGK